MRAHDLCRAPDADGECGDDLCGRQLVHQDVYGAWSVMHGDAFFTPVDAETFDEMLVRGAFWHNVEGGPACW